MFDIKKNIQAMTTFRRNPGKFMKHRQEDEETAGLYHQWKGGSGGAGCHHPSTTALSLGPDPEADDLRTSRNVQMTVIGKERTRPSNGRDVGPTQRNSTRAFA